MLAHPMVHILRAPAKLDLWLGSAVRASRALLDRPRRVPLFDVKFIHAARSSVVFPVNGLLPTASRARPSYSSGAPIIVCLAYGEMPGGIIYLK